MLKVVRGTGCLNWARPGLSGVASFCVTREYMKEVTYHEKIYDYVRHYVDFGLPFLGISIVISSVLPNILRAYLTANLVSFNHEILYPDMTMPYIYSAVMIIAGFVGVFYFGSKIKE